MLCEEMMKSDIECVTPTDTVEKAAARMRDLNVGFLPVCDQANKVIGAITDRDIAIRVVAARKAGSTPVQDVMTREVISCRPGDDVQKAQQLMAQNHKSRIMCIDKSGKLMGVISLSDIAQQDGEMASETLRQVTSREARV